MTDPVAEFLLGSNPVLGAALVPRDERPVLVLVVDDSEDDELVAVIASATLVPAPDYVGVYGAQVSSQGLTIKFLLARAGGGWGRTWTLQNMPDDILAAMTGAHYVAILPRELASDLGALVLESLGGAIIVEAQSWDAVAAARAAE